MNASLHALRAPAAFADDPLIAELADELACRWERGDRVLAEELLERHAELRDAPQRAIGVIYEEICQRQEQHASIAAADWFHRFPAWRAQLEFLLECHRLLENPVAPRRAPKAGDTLAGYQLLAPLGGGAGGRVFLARQPALADRPVVVKITDLRGQEHLNLARLQHTHIVPLYAVHDAPAQEIRVLCMPYFGGATLDRVLLAQASRPHRERTGAAWLEAVQVAGVQPAGPGTPLLGRLAPVQAVCWIGACLAEALHYAHEAGLVHLDVKPANVLIAADGQPMLLDFHLARGQLHANEPAPEGIGGTPGYMPPEQQQAMHAVAHGRPIPLALDGRTDVFALGAILYEALGGTMPFVHGQTAPLCRQNELVSVGLSDLLMRCLAPAASDRYADAAQLADDLRRHLANRPLRGVRNRSWPERFTKWRRRFPTARIMLFVAGLLVCLAVPTLGTTLFQEVGQHSQPTEPADGSGQRRRFETELHGLADQVRMTYGTEAIPAAQLLRLDASCRTLWESRRQVRQRLDGASSPQVAEDMIDVALFTIDVRQRTAPSGQQMRARGEALAAIDEAQELFGPSPVIEWQRQRQHGILTLPTDDRSPTAAQTEWELFTLGRLELQAGDLAKASAHLEKALARAPHEFWPNYYHGLYTHRAGRNLESVAAFSVCIGAAPDKAIGYFNRALAYAALGLSELAVRDYDCALEMDPGLGCAALNRGMLHYAGQRFALAEADLHRALALGADPATTHFNLALLFWAQQQADLARHHLNLVLSVQPDHHPAQEMLSRLATRPVATGGAK